MLFSVLDFREEYRQTVLEERILYNSSMSTDSSFNYLKENTITSSNFNSADNQFIPEVNDSFILTKSEINSDFERKTVYLNKENRNVFCLK